MTQGSRTIGSRAGSKGLIREMNEALVLDVVRRHGTTSRAEIASATGLSAATVTGISGQLVGSGLLVETDVLRGTGGRPARLLQLGTDAVIVAGARVSPASIDIALVNLRGEVVGAHREPLERTDPESTAIAVARAVAGARRATALESLRGVSVAVSGIVDQASGLVRHSGSLGWEDVPFAAMVAEHTSGRVVVDSLVNSYTRGLLLLDDDLAERDLVVCSVGASLGASIVVRGHVHPGYNGSAGGFAHTRPLAADTGRPCHCGDVECLETWSSVWGMTRELERRGTAWSDTAAAADVLAQGGERLGVALATAGKMFGPEGIVAALAPEAMQAEFLSGCRDAYAREFRHGAEPGPDLRLLPAEPEVFARGAGYTMVAELFTVAEPGRH